MTEALSTSLYEGERRNGRMEGHGKYTFPSGTVYTGQILDGEFHGEGVLAYPGGCGQYHATWNRGKVVTGRYVFADGLEYTAPTEGDWAYCRTDGDRRFYSELVNGLRPVSRCRRASPTSRFWPHGLAEPPPPRACRGARARAMLPPLPPVAIASLTPRVSLVRRAQAGDSQLTNAHPPPKVPPGTYDTGDGYFKVDEGEVFSYEGEKLRRPDQEEEQWIKSKCRKG